MATDVISRPAPSRAARALLLASVSALLALGAVPPPGSAGAPRDPRLAAVRSWAFGIGDGALSGDVARRFRGYDLVVVDGEEVTRGQVKALRAAGAVVLAYLDVGAIEPYRSWYPRARPFRRERWTDWGEWWADTSRPAYRRLVTRGLAPPILAKGVDGLFLDNVDMISDHPRQARGMRALVAALGRLVHRRGGLLFAQNGEDVIGPMLGELDGWNREDVTATYDFARRRYVPTDPSASRAAQAALRAIARHGLLTLAADYVAPRQEGGRLAAAAARNACAAGAVPYVSDIGLGGVAPARSPACPPR